MKQKYKAIYAGLVIVATLFLTITFAINLYKLMNNKPVRFWQGISFVADVLAILAGIVALIAFVKKRNE